MKKEILLLAVLSLLNSCSSAAPSNKLLSFLYPTFYMKIIDQDGQPVQGIEISATHGYNAIIWSNLGSSNYVSDENGIIPIKVDSRKLSLRLGGEGRSNKHYLILLHDILYNYHIYHYLKADFFGKFNRKEKPLMIPAWRIDSQEKNASCENKHVTRIKLNANGRPYDIGLGMQISFRRDDLWSDKMFHTRRDDFLKNKWRFDISMKSGGLIEINSGELYQEMAPKFGYIKKTWHLDNTTFQPLRNIYGSDPHMDRRSFFLKLTGGHYARLTIEFTPFNTHDDFNYSSSEVTIDYSINEDATRYVRGFHPGYQRTYNYENNCVNLGD